MRTLLGLLVTALALHLPRGAGAAPGAEAPDAINVAAGDESWVETFGAELPPDAPEDARIATHLAWAEARLRAAPVLDLSPAQRVARVRSLDHLHAYREAGVFPRWHGEAGGRRPRWVDDEGRHCAVAALVHASGNDALVAEVQRAHESDFVANMHVPRLAIWARDHGFTVDELALIQPSYADGSFGVSRKDDQRRAREEAARRARIPRPLSTDLVRNVIHTFDVEHVTRDCAGNHTDHGHWTVELDVRVRMPPAVEAQAIVKRVIGDAREPALEACVANHLRLAMETFIASANHTFGGEVQAHRPTVPVNVASAPEVQARFIAQRRAAERSKPLAACEAIAPQLLPVRVPLRVASWNGGVSIRWNDMPKTPMEGMTERERDFWYCLQSSLTYGDSLPIGQLIHDTEFDVQVARGAVVTVL